MRGAETWRRRGKRKRKEQIHGEEWERGRERSRDMEQ